MHYLQPFNPFGLFQGLFIPEGVARSRELSHAAKLTYGRLIRYAGRDGRCFPAVASLAEEIGVDSRQARRYLSELEDLHLIRRVARKRDDGGNTSNAIEFLWHKLLDGACLPPIGENRPDGRLDLASQRVTNRAGHEESPYEDSHLREQQQGEWPQTNAAVTDRFETVDGWFLMQLRNVAAQAVLSHGGNIEELTDSSLAAMVKDAIKEKPKGLAGLLLDTVPTIIENRLKRQKRALAAAEAQRRHLRPPSPLDSGGGPFPPQE